MSEHVACQPVKVDGGGRPVLVTRCCWSVPNRGRTTTIAPGEDREF